MPNTLTYTIGNDTTEIKVPSSISELGGAQLVEAARLLEGGEPDMAVLTGIPADVWADMAPFQQYSVMELFDFVNVGSVREASFKEWKLPTIRVDGEEWFGPIGNFGNVTWEEFVYADQCMMNGMHIAAVAALFRPKRKDYDGETDIRIPFTTYGTTNRFKRLEGLDKAVQTAILINYRAMRKASLEERYGEVFPYADFHPGDEEEDGADKGGVESKRGSFSWISVHRSILGDNIQDEDKYLRLGVHTVLYRLNAAIAESRKSKH